ncbi:MAG TPA: polysaccharide deacetylase [Candidatus Mediterraneibacter stercoravium]|uniref:Polysaccharide deacetylase n=1 Tax=Candidatus Mediterraneibacter stercoravium TaxID=2838685 RepID=A0A9D2G8A1_9FIRM|nr:polysaccharide deacetylase [Candidatus Mediterraneibacter stercoravium]
MVANGREAAREEQRIAAEKKQEEEKLAAEEKAREEEEQAEKERMQSDSVQPGVPVGTTEADDNEKVVYLTFDDGPSKNTQKVLDILDEYNAKATFFITGQQPEYLSMIKTAYDAGHTIGLHSYIHDYEKVYASVDAYFEDLEKIGEIAKEQIGFVPCYIRFPGGASNTVSRKYTKGIMSKLTEMVQEKGYQYYDWNVSSGDGSKATKEEIIKQSETDEYNHIMILFHDAATKDTTVEALPEILKYYQDHGYEFRAIDRDSLIFHHQTNN